MKSSIKHLVVGSLLLLGAAGCTDLVVVNENDPDAARSLSSAGDVESLIAGSFNTWFSGTYSFRGPGLFLANASFQFNAPWSNFGMEQYGRLPRISIINDESDGVYNAFSRPWFFSYRAIAAVSDGLRALENADIAAELGADDVTRLQAFGYFNLGLSHATLAAFFARGFAVDETTDVAETQEFLDYNALMTEALGYFDRAIAISSTASFTLPLSWMQIMLTGPQLAELAYSYKARFRALVARTEVERAAVDWGLVMSDIGDGITADLVPFYDDFGGWSLDVLWVGNHPGWGQEAYYMFGMADQSGDYQRWDALSLSAKSFEFVGGEPVLIVTPDLRFPQGTTVDEQRLAVGTQLEITTAGNQGGVWKRPDRGTWRWSWYQSVVGRDYTNGIDFNQREIDHTEMRLLMAEGLFRAGDMAGAAAIINETRVPAGLNATDAAGLNTSCVPKLPNDSCGSLWEMLKWEKRMETMFFGLASAPWYFDGRGWGDLYQGTPLHFPVPCGELLVLQLSPCETFGGPGGAMSAPVSTYGFNGET